MEEEGPRYFSSSLRKSISGKEKRSNQGDSAILSSNRRRVKGNVLPEKEHEERVAQKRPRSLEKTEKIAEPSIIEMAHRV